MHTQVNLKKRGRRFLHPLKQVVSTPEIFMIIAGFDAKQFRDLICRVLGRIGLYSPAATELLMGTCAVESDFGRYLRQLFDGPARGVFQMEPDTEQDIWTNYLSYRPKIADRILTMCGVGEASEWALETNLAYQIAIARIHYLRVSEPLPEWDDVDGLAKYWKLYYNTPAGRGGPEDFYRKYLLHC